MTRLLYDSITARDIPLSAPMVGYYDDGPYAWSASDLDLFPRSVQVGITTNFRNTRAKVLDAESGGATEAQTVTWVSAKRALGMIPTVYLPFSWWDDTRRLFDQVGMPEPLWWVAKWDRDARIPDGAIAKQYANSAITGGHFDLSVVADYWPGVDPEPVVLYPPHHLPAQGDDEMGFLTPDPAGDRVDELYVGQDGQCYWGVFGGGAGGFEGYAQGLGTLGSPAGAKDLVQVNGCFTTYQNQPRLNVRGIRADGSRWVKVMHTYTYHVIEEWAPTQSSPPQLVRAASAG